MKEQARKNTYFGLIFLTGATVLALEVLASRIMTPYFGVSLYIWAGILSITLVFLALGYYIGGYVSSRLKRSQIELLFLAAPVAGSLGMAVSISVYPIVFPLLAEFSLTIGSFTAATVLLSIPLVCMSAMNPLLVAWQTAQDTVRGDGGAGRVFFVSTMGSVAGVIVTAFVLIPNLTNYSATLLLAFGLSMLILLSTLLLDFQPASLKRRLMLACIVTAVISISLLMGKSAYLEYLSASSNKFLDFNIRAEYSSIFGNIKVAEVTRKDGRGEPILYYMQDGMVQNKLTKDGTPVSSYIEALNKLVSANTPERGRVLVLGLGAGVLPTKLKADGKDVTVVEINQDSFSAAIDHFGFQPEGIDMVWQDARTYVRRCSKQYDAVVIDLFHGDSTPDYLMSTEFFADVSDCLGPDGVSVMNAHFDSRTAMPNQYLLATVASVFSHVRVYRALRVLTSPVSNAYVVASNARISEEHEWSMDDVPRRLRLHLKMALQSGKAFNKESAQGISPISDEHNTYSVLLADTQKAYRRAVVSAFPPLILVN